MDTSPSTISSFDILSSILIRKTFYRLVFILQNILFVYILLRATDTWTLSAVLLHLRRYLWRHRYKFQFSFYYNAKRLMFHLQSFFFCKNKMPLDFVKNIKNIDLRCKMRFVWSFYYLKIIFSIHTYQLRYCFINLLFFSFFQSPIWISDSI